MRRGALLLFISTLLACSGDDSGASSPKGEPACAAGEERFRGRCVDPARRYEPDERLDTDNVSAYGDPFTQTLLPEPPKSGFRIMAPPRLLQPGEEDLFCLSWPYPTFQNEIIYAGRLYTTPGLHHSNLIAKPIDADTGPNPYPGCHPGASDPFSDIGSGVPDVLFASSTQVTGEETLAFAPGMGFRVDKTREIVTNIHLLNTSSEPLLVEVAYDFFTMPEAELENEVAPFTMQVDDFLIPPHSKQTIGSTCKVFGGNVVSVMPHTHDLRRSFTVDLLDYEGKARDTVSYGAFDASSDIKQFHPPLSLEGIESIRFACAFDNTTDHDVVYGIGEDEMCILFGYMYPVDTQVVAHAPFQGEPCESIRIGLFH